MTEKGKKVKFSNFARLHKQPFVIYIHFETLRSPTNKKKPVFVSQPCGFAYSIKSSIDNSVITESYVGENCVKILWEKLENVGKTLSKKICAKIEPLAQNDEEKNQMSKISQCYLCYQRLEEDKIADFCLLSGKYLGTAHQDCARIPKIAKSIPIVVSKKGLNFLLAELSNEEIKNIFFFCNEKEAKFGFVRRFSGSLQLKFLDVEKFLNEKILDDTILEDSKKKNLKKMFGQKFDLVKTQPVFPFSFIKDFTKLEEKFLPPRGGFFDQFQDEEISEKEYLRCEKIWKSFNCVKVSDYVKVCLVSSVLLLEDIFENFRNLCLDKYRLDPIHYLTIASIAWDTMLKYTKIELEILQDKNMINFIKNNIRGGIVQCSKRYAIANNQFCQYNKTKPENFLVCLDANNLAGWAMSQKLPFSEFTWLSQTGINKIQNSHIREFDEEGDFGYIFEVDLEYPKGLHQKHNDLPFCPEILILPTAPSFEEPVRSLNFFPKKNYVIDIRNLKQCLENGLILQKIHRVLKFRQTNWLKAYIDYNTSLRAEAMSEFEKKFYKLLNNSVFGKTIQKTSFDKPIYAGFCILELSKKFMYDFHYNVMLQKYPENISLLFMDTDSFLYDIQTENFYNDLKSDKKLLEMFDTSNLDKKWEIPPKNQKLVGKMKDEYCGKIIREFCGVGAKVYCLDVEGEEIKKAVGMKKYVKRKYVSIQDYRNCVLRNTQVRKNFLITECENYVLNTYWNVKVVLSPGDKKRWIAENKIDTFAWGFQQ